MGKLKQLIPGLTCWLFSTFVVVFSAWLSYSEMELNRSHPGSHTRVDFLSSFAAWDGEWYVGIAKYGYAYKPTEMSNVAFFPLYPMLGRVLVLLTGLRADLLLVLLANGSLAVAYVIFSRYTQVRVDGKGVAAGDQDGVALLAMSLFPTTFWMRMCYTEAMFMMLCILALFGMARKWNPLWVALVIGAATATRATGIALVPVLALWLFHQSDTMMKAGKSLLIYGPVSLWGLLLYMLYLQLAHGNAFAFSQTQVHWRELPDRGISEELYNFLSLKVFWGIYSPDCDCYWGRVPPGTNFLLNMKFLNPVYVLLAIGCVAIGLWKQILNHYEAILAAGLIAVPLVTKGFECCLISQARYVSVAFPMYIVIGAGLLKLSATNRTLVYAMSAVMMGAYTTMFVKWHWFY